MDERVLPFRSSASNFDVVVVGAGSAGCVVASRLSENRGVKVGLIEAGMDLPPGEEPADILDTYAGNAYVNGAYRWDNIFISLSLARPNTSRKRVYEQARIMGGTSSINGQVAVRGAKADYDAWERLGAAGWSWKDVEPYFTRLESDLDFDGSSHGQNGPIFVRRIFPEQWDALSSAAAEAMNRAGYEYLSDLNGPYVEGYGPLPISNRDGRRVSAAMGYLTTEVRRRANLKILAGQTVKRVLFNGTAACGVEVVEADGIIRRITARHIVVSAGVMNSPKLLMLSGIGEESGLKALGIPTVANLPGVGQNLHDHAAVSFSAYLPSWARFDPIVRRHAYINLRYSSRVEGCPEADMILNPVSRSAWHPLGWRLATFQIFIGKPFSRGALKLASANYRDSADIDMNFLSDKRDCLRLMDGIRRGARLLKDQALSNVALDPFPSAYSTTAQKIGARTFVNKIKTAAGAAFLEGPSWVRRAFIKSAITGGETLDGIIGDEARLENYVRDNVSVGWHACGTCRMGADGDERAVVLPSGRVRKTQGLWVADASIIPEIPRSNINLPTIMIGEKVADQIAKVLSQEVTA